MPNQFLYWTIIGMVSFAKNDLNFKLSKPDWSFIRFIPNGQIFLIGDGEFRKAWFCSRIKNFLAQYLLGKKFFQIVDSLQRAHLSHFCLDSTLSHLGKLIENVIATFVRKDIKSKLYWRALYLNNVCNQFYAFLVL